MHAAKSRRTHRTAPSIRMGIYVKAHLRLEHSDPHYEVDARYWARGGGSKAVIPATDCLRGAPTTNGRTSYQRRAGGHWWLQSSVRASPAGVLGSAMNLCSSRTAARGLAVRLAGHAGAKGPLSGGSSILVRSPRALAAGPTGDGGVGEIQDDRFSRRHGLG
jgi:hypothetical protein